MSALFSIEGSVALVTGGAGGIGEAVALGLASEGAAVAVVDLTQEGVDRVTAGLVAAGHRAIGIVADVTKPEDLAAAVARTQSELGPLKHAVNCAGVNYSAVAESMSLEEWSKVIDINLTGVFLSCQAEGAAMIANGGGSIVNIGSISATIANRGLKQAQYNSAKAGVLHLTTSLALEWADRNIRVNTVSPGYTRTPMATNPEVWEHVKKYIPDIPLNRMAEPDELVGPVVFLLSDAASYVTAVNLNVDGGAVAW